MTCESRSSEGVHRGWLYTLWRLFVLLFCPVRKVVIDGREAVVYVSMNKEFYLWMIWLPGLVSSAWAASGAISVTAMVWMMLASIFLWYVTIRTRTDLKLLIFWVIFALLVLLAYRHGYLDVLYIPQMMAALQQLSLGITPQTLWVISMALFVVWLINYVYCKIYRVRILTANIRRYWVFPIGSRSVGVTGTDCRNEPRDWLEFIFGLGAYSVVFRTRTGRVLAIDHGCVLLPLVLRTFRTLIDQINTASVPGAEGTDGVDVDDWGEEVF